MGIVRKIFIALIFIICVLLGAGVYLVERDWIDFSVLEAYKNAQPSLVLDDEGNELARFELDKCAPVTFDKLPRVLVNAFIAAEDHGFFHHAGVSLRGIVRSTLVNLYHRRVVQGASTITQQLARLVFLTYERTWLRKAQEVFIAFQLERQDRKSTRLNSSHIQKSRMPSSA